MNVKYAVFKTTKIQKVKKFRAQACAFCGLWLIRHYIEDSEGYAGELSKKDVGIQKPCQNEHQIHRNI
jgi:hypothetical protein